MIALKSYNHSPLSYNLIPKSYNFGPKSYYEAIILAIILAIIKRKDDLRFPIGTVSPKPLFVLVVSSSWYLNE